ncbi:MAG: Crp/Fnr family transcriptional regulator [Gammaproteobacteria bacterium]|nr:Crp/Fnr family transcriptional regulator [Gammaproteobacteria bacterium]
MQRDESAANKWLFRFPELSKIDDPVWLEAVQAARIRSIPQGTVIFRPGDPCMSFVLVQAGTVRIYLPSETGREILLYRVDAGEICILTLSNLLGGNSYAAEGVTETDAQLVIIPPHLFEQALTTSHAFRRYIFSMIGRRLGEIMLLLEEITFKRLDLRLAQLLLRAINDNNNQALHKTHQDIAAELGSSREVISRLLKDFERNSLVRLDRGQIQVLSQVNMEQYISRFK